MSFPPVTNQNIRNLTIQQLAELQITHIRITENWSRRGLTPAIDDFVPLSRRLSHLHSAGIQILLTVQSDGPDPACLIRNEYSCLIAPTAPFEDYVEMLLMVIGDDIEAIQFGNEWDNQFVGSPDEYVELQRRFAKTVRKMRPDLPIVLGGITGYSPYFYALCAAGATTTIFPDAADLCAENMDEGNRRQASVQMVLAQGDYDIVDLHLYDAVELWPAGVRWMETQTAGRPIWVTEFGGPHPSLEPHSPEYQAERLDVYLDVASRLAVERLYYFKLRDSLQSYHGNSGLYDVNGFPKPALLVFQKNRTLFLP